MNQSDQIVAALAPFTHVDLNKLMVRHAATLPSNFKEYVEQVLKPLGLAVGREHPVLLRWNVIPQSGVPFGPFRVSRIETRNGIWSIEQLVRLSKGQVRVTGSNPRRISLTETIHQRFGPNDWIWGLQLAVLKVEGSAPTGTLRPIDRHGRCFPEAAIPVRGSGFYVLTGPNIFGFLASGEFDVKDVFGLSAALSQLEERGQIVQVGRAGFPGPREWCGLQGYEPGVTIDPVAAATDRLTLEFLVRRDSYSPAVIGSGLDMAVLDDPTENLKRVMSSEIIQRLLTDMKSALANPQRTATFTLDNQADATTVKASMRFSHILQMLAGTDACAGAALGHGIVDVAAHGIKEAHVAPEFHAAIKQDPFFAGPFPIDRTSVPQAWPFYVIEGRFWNPDDGDPVPDSFDLGSRRILRTIAHLERRGVDSELLVAKESGRNLSQRILPRDRDDNYRATIELVLKELSALAQGYFVKRTLDGDAKEWVNSTANGPAHFNPIVPNPHSDRDATNNVHEIFDHAVSLRSDEATAISYEAWSRDRFGRMAGPRSGSVAVQPPDVGTPDLKRIWPNYRPNGDIDLCIELGWEWTHRSPSEFRLAGGFTDVPVAGSPPADLPVDALFELPSSGNKVDLRLVFGPNLDDPPTLQVGGNPMAGSSVEKIDYPATETQEVPSSTLASRIVQRRYRVRIPFGSAAVIFAQGSSRLYQVVCDATERVSGNRRSKRPSQTVNCRLSDPRPPIRPVLDANFVWSAFPDRNRIARARISWQPSTGPAIGGYRLWTAGEAALVDALIAHQPDLAIALQAISGLDSRRARADALAQFFELHKQGVSDGKPFVERLFEYLTLELDNIPATNTSAEFLLGANLSALQICLVSAYSRTGVDNDRLDKPQIAFVAVPHAPRLDKPKLRVLTEDVSGALQAMGAALLIVGTNDAADSNSLRLLEAVTDTPDDSTLMLPIKDAVPIDSAAVDFHLGSSNAIDAFRKEMSVDHVSCFRYRPAPTWHTRAFSAEVVHEDPTGSGRRFRSAPSEAALASVAPVSIPRMTNLRVVPQRNASLDIDAEFSGLPTGVFMATQSSAIIEIQVAKPSDRTSRTAAFVFPVHFDEPGKTFHVDSKDGVYNLSASVADAVDDGCSLTCRIVKQDQLSDLEIAYVRLHLTDPAGRKSRVDVFQHERDDD